MPYSSHFKLADDMIFHLDSIINGVADSFIASRYVGFVAVAAVTVYELAIKDIFREFGLKKHKVLGNFTEVYFDRINGRIKIKTIRDDYIKKFGEKYVKRFEKKIEATEKYFLKNNRVSIKSSYLNIIEWRNSFAHEGLVPSFVTYNEVTKSYEFGKEVVRCLAETMRY